MHVIPAGRLPVRIHSIKSTEGHKISILGQESIAWVTST